MMYELTVAYKIPRVDIIMSITEDERYVARVSNVDKCGTGWTPMDALNKMILILIEIGYIVVE